MTSEPAFADRAARWLLSGAQRGNPHTRLDAGKPNGAGWTSGNLVRPLVHGATYFRELYDTIEATQSGDLVLFVDWRGDPDERLTGEPGSEVATVLARADERGVDVRGLLWRSHTDKIAFSAEENRSLADDLQEAHAETLLDMRVRSGGAHHQKFVVVRHRDDPTRDVAFVGGIDLCHSRRDDERHLGDPQALSMPEVYGPRPPWHDLQCAIHGPAVYDVETSFRERWEDPRPLSRNPVNRVRDLLVRRDTEADPLPPQAPPPPEVEGGTHHVQILRTYANLRRLRDYPFAVGGERSIARAYAKALGQARQLVYLEDQYLWSGTVAGLFERALREQPGLHLVAVIPHYPDQTGVGGRAQLLGRWRAISGLRQAAPGRVAVYGIENHEGTPVYLHAKTCVIDDWWASIGSDNFNRRSWTHDSELSAAVVDEAGGGHSAYARRLRLTLAAEHLDRPAGADDLLEVMADCVDGPAMFEAFAQSAQSLQAWHDAGRSGPRPPGRLRPIQLSEPGGIEQALLRPIYALAVDPDGRPWGTRRRNAY